MKIKNEVRIALVAVIGIMLLFFGMQFLKGLDLFSSDTPYKMKFDDISGLSASSPIYADGFRVGTVKGIDYDFNKRGDITVDVGINKEMQIPEGTRAEIVSDLLGNVQVNLLMDRSVEKLLAPGGLIDGTINDGAMGQVKSMVPAIQQMLPKLDSILTNVNALLANPNIAASLHNVNLITSDLTNSTRQLNQILAQVNQQFPQLMGKTDRLLDNANGTMASAGGMIANVNGKLDGVDVAATMQKVEQTLANVQQLTDKLNDKKGSLGLLMNDNALYDNLSSTVRDADSLLVNLKAHPKRYVHFSIFGKKDK